MIRSDPEPAATPERIARFRQQVESNAASYRLSAGGCLAQLDRLFSALREQPGLGFSEVALAPMPGSRRRLGCCAKWSHVPAATIPADKELYQRQIEVTDRQIDALVYELYGLTEEEIDIVEGSR